MRVDTLAETRVRDRVYRLEAVKPSFNGEVCTGEIGEEPNCDVKWRVTITQDAEAAVGRRCIVNEVYAVSRYQANGLFRTFIDIATHHYFA